MNDHEFFDNGVSFSHDDFNGERSNVHDDSCIYLDVKYDEWQGHLDSYKQSELTVMINKNDAIAIAKQFNLLK